MGNEYAFKIGDRVLTQDGADGTIDKIEHRGGTPYYRLRLVMGMNRIYFADRDGGVGETRWETADNISLLYPSRRG
jgi:hypothetical protein